MFQDVSDRIPDNRSAFMYGAAVSDIDSDGVFEIVVAGYDGPNRIFQFHEGQFREQHDSVLADPQRQAIGLAAGDFDGDGQEELYILNSDQFAGLKLFSDRLFDFDGEKWRDLFIAEGEIDLLNMTAGRSVCAVDRLGSGRYGFFVANYGGPMRLYELTEDGHIVDVAPFAKTDIVTGGRSLVSMPLLSRHMDVICGTEGGANALFRNRGDGTFDEVATELGFEDSIHHARGLAPIWLGDSFGLVLGNWEGRHRLLKLNDQGRFDDIAPPAFAEPSRVRTVIVADFDNDGYEEIFFNNMAERNRLFAWRDDQWREIDAGDATEERGAGTGAVMGDFDRDGHLELLVAHGEAAPQPLSYFQTEPNDNHFVRVLPRTETGAPARGALVTVSAAGRRWCRAIDAGSGYLCQMEPVAHFGLGALDRIDEVEVAFPSGRTITFAHHEIDCLLDLQDPGP